MTNGTVPDTGLIEAFRPLKTGGGGNQDKPACGNCLFGTKDAHGAGGILVCIRFPPELQMVVRNTMTGMQQVPNVGFKPVHERMVCGEHPALQARMQREVTRAAAMANSTGRVTFPPDQEALATQQRVEARAARAGDPGVPMSGVGFERPPGPETDFEREVRLKARIGDPGVPVHAIGDDRRKPGDDPT